MSNRPRKRISQSAIAKEAGCSQSLVSMVLNGRTQGISEETYRRIREIALKNGYSLPGMKADANGTSDGIKSVGYILRSPLKLANKSNFFSHVHQGLHETLVSERIKTVYLGSEDDLASNPEELASLVSDNIKAIAIMGEVAPHFLDELKALKRQLIYISARAPGTCHSILSNEGDSAQLLVDRLYELGHRNFAWIGGNYPSSVHDDRLAAFEKALDTHSLKLDPKFLIHTKRADRNEGYDAAHKICQSVASKDELPTAWLSLNALMARGAINYLFQSGYKVPSDVSIAAYDMTRVCEEERPGITSAGADPEAMGAEAARIILQFCERGNIPLMDLTLQSAIVERETTGPARTPAEAGA
ncbi:LacI family DNA-binding transcriptional regulator [Pelagicoccus mobilis]|uniref:LacI family DNA-binding transcriptional regulator n=1 Tax=Pelagicoccus mobilis TaxID=415221 RepID=A0A934RXF1_9BACT|nr:LacI family DNA-binding transcriptional regulator [Pelagicoccus mobilis]MBK1875343.1 LacI family DNA-binding transcriptional regulator [Pelagicoccus mobilis]